MLWKQFVAGIEPLHRTGKLGALHFQFAPWFEFGSSAFAHIEEVRQRLSDLRIAVEFRNYTWFNGERRQQTLAFERERRLSHVVVDEPQGFDNSIPAVWEVTTPELALVRLHGRNAETWNAKGITASSERFNYDYPDDELGALAGNIVELSRGVQYVHALFNNNYGDQGQRNARTLRRIIDGGVWRKLPVQ